MKHLSREASDFLAISAIFLFIGFLMLVLPS